MAAQHNKNAADECDLLDLISKENLGDRASPELWPEQMPGVSEFAAMGGLASTFSGCSTAAKPKWMNDLEADDVNTVHELSNLTPAQLLDRIRKLQNLAYQLGLEEAREMTRGKFLNILQRPRQGLGA
ncbi:protein lin-52 homolog [Watersipora subatra]|uniref:protein lin-52 homolog n=1 Tax=Watersipora subatra TaxID=2589382 RepID=UPI00355BA054